MLRSRHTIPLLILTVIIGGIAVATALLIDWLPVRASEQADRIFTLIWFVVWVSLGIFTLVTVVLIYSAWRFRVKPGDDSDGPPIHGNTKLEITWTLVPAALLAVVAVWAYLVLSQNEALAQDRLVVNVTAEQFAWTFTYPEGQVATGDLRLPVGRQVELRMRSKDVIHDLWVREFGWKQDVVPGVTTRLIYDPTKVGVFQVVCAELCGVGHALMRARVIVMEPADYEAWLADARRQVAAAGSPPATDTGPVDPAAAEDAETPEGEAPELAGDRTPGRPAPEPEPAPAQP